MSQNHCRQADKWDWIAQIVASTTKATLEAIKQTQLQVPTEKKDSGLHTLCEVGISACEFATYEINKNLCVPIAR
jgi:hypothetical protein